MPTKSDYFGKQFKSNLCAPGEFLRVQHWAASAWKTAVSISLDYTARHRVAALKTKAQGGKEL